MHLVLPVSTAPGDMTVKPGSGCHRSGGPLCPVISTPAHSSSGWVDVGAMMDTFNHGSWNLPFGPYVLHVGVKTGGTAAAPVITAIGEFEAPGATYGLQLVFDASTRATHRIRHQGADFWELSEALTTQTKDPAFHAGRTPEHVPIFGSFFDAVTPSGGGNKSPVCPECGATYTKAQATMQDMIGMTTYGTDLTTTRKGYVDVRGCITSEAAMLKCLEVYVNASTTDNILVVSLGDEIGVSDPNPNNTNAAMFAAWCTAEGHTGKPGCGGVADTKISSAKGDATTNGHYYYSLRFMHDAGIARYKKL